MGNWLTRNQAQELLNAASNKSPRGWRDGAMLGLLLGCGLRRSEVVGLNLDQLQSREGRWVIVNLIGEKNGYERYLYRRGVRTFSMPLACAMVVEANWNRFSFSSGTLLCRLRSATSEANRSFKMR
jgi:integrase/recombinase XerD